AEAVARVADEHAGADMPPRRETARSTAEPPMPGEAATEAAIAPDAVADALSGDGTVPATGVVEPGHPAAVPRAAG
ncbi:hypothetical protein MKL20_01790, partial [Methylobacterium sp. E-066]|nr:hypothetical protein [Methylobacterium sp. E-066]